jgi:hypothetical protein
MSFAEELPLYASKVQQTIEPVSRKIQDFQQSAGKLTNDVHPTKKSQRFGYRSPQLGLIISCAVLGLYGER